MRHDLFLIEIGKKVRKHRKAKKITLVQMSSDVGVHIAALSFLERGYRDFHILLLKRIAERLDMDIKELL